MPLGLSVEDGARVLGVAVDALEQLVGETGTITPELAVRLEKAFGPSAEMWLRLQMSYDLAAVRRREDDIQVSRYVRRPDGEAQSNAAA